MFCKYCGAELEDGMKFCDQCGRQQSTVAQAVQNVQKEQKRQQEQKKQQTQKEQKVEKEQKEQKPADKKKRSALPLILIAILLILICIGAGVGGYFYLNSSSVKNIVNVKKGYLGQYTDVTVGEVFSEYYKSQGHGKGTWTTETSGEDSFVLLRYDSVQVSFRILDNGCFRVEELQDPTSGIENDTDLVYFLNEIYFTHYHTAEVAADRNKGMELIGRLYLVDGSVVRYGAPESFDADRANLCSQFGEEPMGRDVPTLLNEYNLINLDDYDPEKLTTEAEEAATEPTEVWNPPTAATQPVQTELTPTESRPPMPQMKTGYVQQNTDGLNIRSGPGTNYGIVGRLVPNTQVTILEIRWEDDAYWGCISSDEWICMDYVGSQPAGTLPENDSQQHVGYVRESSGGLNIYSGPGANYPIVGRLEPNDRMIILEDRAVGNVNWGRIGLNQWVSMEYVVDKSALDSAQLFREVIRGQRQMMFCGVEESTDVLLYVDINNLGGLGGLDRSLMPDGSFSVVDLDQNGTNEVLVGMNGQEHWYLLLRYQDGEIYGSIYAERSLKAGKNGIIHTSDSTSTSGCYRLTFDGIHIYKTDLSTDDRRMYWEPAEIYPMTSDNIERYIAW